MPAAQRPTPYKERVLRWLNAKGPGTYNIDTITEDLENMTRRQITTALHGLAHYGLTNQLTNIGKGLWSYTPKLATHPGNLATQQNSPRAIYTYTPPPEAPREVPIGWEGQFTVVTKTRIGGRIEYDLVTQTGTLLRAVIIDSCQSYVDH